MEQAAKAIIERLQLSPHPEGGWYRETWRAEAAAGERAGGTAIHFLLEADQRSHWHRVDAAEVWLWHAGSPLALLTAPDDAGPVTRRAGRRCADGGAAAACCANRPLAGGGASGRLGSGQLRCVPRL